jgi:hypothetical protein
MKPSCGSIGSLASSPRQGLYHVSQESTARASNSEDAASNCRYTFPIYNSVRLRIPGQADQDFKIVQVSIPKSIRSRIPILIRSVLASRRNGGRNQIGIADHPQGNEEKGRINFPQRRLETVLGPCPGSLVATSHRLCQLTWNLGGVLF